MYALHFCPGPDVDSPDGRRAQQCFLPGGYNGNQSKGPPSVYHPLNLPRDEIKRPTCSDAVSEKPCKGNAQPLLVARGLTVSQGM